MLGNKKPAGMQMAQNNDKFPIKSNPSQQMSQQFVQPKQQVVTDPLLKMQQ